MNHKGYAQLAKVDKLVLQIYRVCTHIDCSPDHTLDMMRSNVKYRRAVADSVGVTDPSDEVLDLVAGRLTWLKTLPDLPATTYPSPT